jgi:hypothetical protein
MHQLVTAPVVAPVAGPAPSANAADVNARAARRIHLRVLHNIPIHDLQRVAGKRSVHGFAIFVRRTGDKVKVRVDDFPGLVAALKEYATAALRAV